VHVTGRTLTICNKTLFHCGPCSKASPESLVNDDFSAYERNERNLYAFDYTEIRQRILRRFRALVRNENQKRTRDDLPKGPKCLPKCPQVAARLQVFTEAFILAMRPAGSSCLAIRASDMLSRVLRLSLS
jgi:hypothetical protein